MPPSVRHSADSTLDAPGIVAGPEDDLPVIPRRRPCPNPARHPADPPVKLRSMEEQARLDAIARWENGGLGY